MTLFSDFGLDPNILKSLDKMGFKEPSDIQKKAIPLIQDGHDLIALAKTGSGKTATCAIPICNRVDVHRSVIQALVVVPTRELAMQYATEVQKIGRDKGVSAFAVYGGEGYALQEAKLRHGVHVLVATPGRLIDFIYSRLVDLSHVETLILDEADEMLGLGFYEDLEFIIQCLVHDHQTLLFSATMPDSIRKLAKQHMKELREVALNKDEVSPTLIQHCFGYCLHKEKMEKLAHWIQELKPRQGIVFCPSRVEVERVCRFLQKKMDGVDFLHAGMGQDVRTIITNKFRTGKLRLLVATDVAGRGLDFSGVTHVFIHSLSSDVETYVHRSGRTGRYGREGTVVTLVTDRDLGLLDRVLKHIGREAIWLDGVEPAPKRSGARSSPPNGKPRPRGGSQGRHQSKPRRPSKSTDREPS